VIVVCVGVLCAFGAAILMRGSASGGDQGSYPFRKVEAGVDEAAIERAETELWDAWSEIVDYASYELNKEGLEAAVLAPLGEKTNAGMFLAWHTSQQDDFYIRCTGPALAGYVTNSHPELLGEIWKGEAARAEGASDFELMECNAVGERIVNAASRWCEHEHLRAAGVEVLRDLVRRTLDGERAGEDHVVLWNTAHQALSTLWKYDREGSAGLFERARASGELAVRMRFLDSGDESVINEVERFNHEADEEAAKVRMPERRASQMEALLGAAERYEALLGG